MFKMFKGSFPFQETYLCWWVTPSLDFIPNYLIQLKACRWLGLVLNTLSD